MIAACVAVLIIIAMFIYMIYKIIAIKRNKNKEEPESDEATSVEKKDLESKSPAAPKSILKRPPAKSVPVMMDDVRINISEGEDFEPHPDSEIEGMRTPERLK